ncbi:unnamed protein product [Protopolystoma xenopodis]|uniref:Uncharacterized protein n=1 Tax=Protopolystoma xenopodis TaxID=117903 RepID=A0A3S5ACM0_9PLAT|nr:unnamed protein product [Protopolystoma xenopodis]
MMMVPINPTATTATSIGSDGQPTTQAWASPVFAARQMPDVSVN